MEALVAVSVASNVVQFVDFASKLVAQISEYAAAADGAPERLRELEARLGLVIQTLKGLPTECLASIDQEQTVILCLNQVKELKALLEKLKLNPHPGRGTGTSWANRQRDRMETTWKALKSLRGQEKVEELQKSLDRLLALLNLQIQVKTSTALDKGNEKILLELEQLRLASEDRKTDISNQSSTKYTIPHLQNPNFVARVDLTDDIERRFASGQRKVVLCGLGGAGKTQLALNYALNAQKMSPDTSIFWVYASSTANFEESYRRIASVCDIPGHQNPQADIMQLVRDWLESQPNRDSLIVVDNVDKEDTLFGQTNSGKVLAEYIPQLLRARLLYTSRNRDVAVDILHDGGEPIEVGPMSPIEAHKLLSAKDKSDSTEEDISTLLQELEYIPLAITQAAAYMSKRHKSAGQYLSLFRGSESTKARLLAHEFVDHGREARCRESIAKTWMISFDHIREINLRAADVLSLMSCYDRQSIPPFLLKNEDEDGLVLEEAIGLLTAFSLISSSDSGVTYSMHRLVQVAMSKWLSVPDPPENEAYELRALEVLAFQFPDSGRGSEPRRAQDAAEAILTHAEKVLARPTPQHEKQDGLNRATLLYRIASYFLTRGRYEEAKSRLKEAYALRIPILGPTHPSTLDTISGLGWISFWEDQFDDCVELLQPVWDNIIEGPATSERLDIARALVCAQIVNKKYDVAESILGKCTSKLQDLAWSSSDILKLDLDLARLQMAKGKYVEAKQLFRDVIHTLAIEPAAVTVQYFMSRVQRNDIVEPWLLLDAMNNLLIVLLDQDQLEEANDIGHNVVAITEEFYGSKHFNTITAICNLAYIQEEIGEYEDAGLMYQKAYKYSEDLYGSSHPKTLEYKNDLEDFEIKMEKRDRVSCSSDDTEAVEQESS